jgi:hypothetical protein
MTVVANLPHHLAQRRDLGNLHGLDVRCSIGRARLTTAAAGWTPAWDLDAGLGRGSRRRAPDRSLPWRTDDRE